MSKLPERIVHGSEEASPRDEKPTDRFDLTDKNFLVTGGGRGIGLATCKGIMQLGGGVAVIDSVDDHKAFYALAEKYGAKAAFAQGDVSDQKSLESAFSKVLDDIGGQLNGTVTCAGVNINEKLVEATWETSKKLLEINVLGSWWTAKLVAKHLQETKTPGSIVLIASISGQNLHIPVQACSIYNASKGAIKQMVGPLAVELGPSGIRVNCISPGCIGGPMVSELEKTVPMIPYFFKTAAAAGRLGVPEDLSPMITYLLSDAGSFTTGSDMKVEGGITSGFVEHWNFREGT